MRYDWSLFSGSQKMLFSRASIYTSLYTGLCYYTKNMLSETICIYGEMAKNHLCITDVTKRFAKKCTLLYNLGQKC